mmetsp:Transcript_18712/g.22939  ORF Transcript_18712/g.22939 Transcript_18712/m.22939 type:complete len:426 (-) Transcript_18712:85-1362(-)
MSESRDSTSSSVTAPVSDPYQQWTKFYMQACLLTEKEKNRKLQEANEEEEGKTDQEQAHHRRILITLTTITKIIFGIDAAKKAKVIVHGGGAIELILALVQASNILTTTTTLLESSVQAKEIIMSSLKAIKTCVVRNPVGRCRCRSAGVLAFLQSILDLIFVDDDGNKSNDEKNILMKDIKSLVEEIFTTLAAICIGDDLNSLQASTQFKPYMNKAQQTYFTSTNKTQSSGGTISSMDQKILYLTKLFVTIEKEQPQLISFVTQKKSKSASSLSLSKTFIEDINEAEINIRTGYNHMQDKKYTQALNHYNRAMKLIESYVALTTLLHPLMIEIRWKRSRILCELKNGNECLLDTMFLLEEECEGKEKGKFNEWITSEMRSDILKHHARALILLHREEEAKEYLGKLSILCPQDEDVVAMMKNLTI